MTDRNNFLDSLRIASPCPVNWNEMDGDDRLRFCRECKLNVYNISAMTRAEAESFIAGTEGRICAKIYRRADGTVITRDCPSVVRSKHRRTSKVAGAALTAMISLCASAPDAQAVSATQNEKAYGSSQTDSLQKGAANASSQTQKDDRPGLSGKVLYPEGFDMPGVRITAIHEATKRETTVISNDEGKFRFDALEAGSYTVKAEADGFQTLIQTGVVVREGESTRLELKLLMAEGTVVLMGIVDAPLDFKTSTGTTTIKTSMGTTTITCPN